MKLSYSWLRTYFNNEYEFYYKYILGLPIDTTFKTYFWTGNQVHNIIEKITTGLEIHLENLINTTELDNAVKTWEITESQRDKAVSDVVCSIENFQERWPDNQYITNKIEADYEWVIENCIYSYRWRIDCITKDNVLIDYKTTSKLTDLEYKDTKLDYLIQAWWYIRLAEINWIKVNKVQFIEIMKTPSKVSSKLLKKDCTTLLDSHNIKYNKNIKKDDMVEILLKNKIIEKQNAVQVVEYNDIEKIKTMFQKLYSDICTKIQNTNIYIPNPFTGFGWDGQKTTQLFTTYLD